MKDPFTGVKAKRLDPMDVGSTYDRWPDLARAGLRAHVALPKKRFRAVYILGMGGSAAAGDILASWLWKEHRVETEVCKGVIGANDLSETLAIACSASGNTEETLSMMSEALERGAVVASTSFGGRLAEESMKLGVPHFDMPEVLAPRYMLPFMVFSCLAVIDKALGLAAEAEAKGAISEMAKLGNRIGMAAPLSLNPSKKLALRLLGKTPSIYGTNGTRGAGIRFKNELNENAKIHASYAEMPELLHNEIQAWEEPSERFVPVMLRDASEEEREGQLADVFTDILAGMGKDPLVVRGFGRTTLSRLVTMTYLLDYASYYVALGSGRDPFPVPLITKLKSTI